MCTRLHFVLYLLGTSPQVNIYYLRTQKHTSQSGFARDFRSLLHLSNSPPSEKSSVNSSERKHPRWFCQSSSARRNRSHHQHILVAYITSISLLLSQAKTAGKQHPRTLQHHFQVFFLFHCRCSDIKNKTHKIHIRWTALMQVSNNPGDLFVK